ncbi:hypothetical protein Ato02nite_062900 [Paractinoplanes toevensis]|uniref:Uncharacterized protein n=1 Tax=Paractinoplanes toevensis TaxID=571911 RepID=A0A919TG23_9ACTN|nr:hypothetical protein Ato02nite_062900 [Actinoplanes toevensis]
MPVAKISRTAAFAVRSHGRDSTRRAISGRRAYRCRSRNAAISSGASTPARGELAMIAYTPAERPAVISAAPGRSRPAAKPGPVSRGSSRRPARYTATPIGTLIRKMAGQLTASVRTPPATKPSAAPPAWVKL